MALFNRLLNRIQERVNTKQQKQVNGKGAVHIEAIEALRHKEVR